jgi:hypothetical protein
MVSKMLMRQIFSVIPGRAKGANPESITRSIQVICTGVMDSGSRFARPE